MGNIQGQEQTGEKPMKAENHTKPDQTAPGSAPKPDAIGNDVEALRADLKSLRDDVSEMMTSLKGTAGQKVKDLAHDLKESGEQVGMRVLDQVGKVKDKGGELAVQLEDQVRERPMISLLVAFGAGLVLSRMMERR